MNKVQDILTPTYQLLVIDGLVPKNILYRGELAPKQIVLEYIDNHYNAIKELNQYYSTAYYCAACNLPHHTEHHKCKSTCQMCLRSPPCAQSELIKCDSCERKFYNQSCFDHHKVELCVVLRKCPVCELEFNAKDFHKCDESKCKLCSEKYIVSPHYCHIKTLKLQDLNKQDKKLKIIVTYDIETIQIQTEEGYYQHQAMLLISGIKMFLKYIKYIFNFFFFLNLKEIVCDDCWNYESRSKITNPCPTCGDGYKEYWGKDCVKAFTNYVYVDLAKRANKPKKQSEKGMVYVIAHNAKGFDAHFILKDLFSRDYGDTELIMAGLKLLKIDIANVRFLDSLSLFQQRLSALPKSFGFESHVRKGFFPHLFNKEENFEYNDILPSLDYFGIKYMKPEVAKSLREWHTERSLEKFNFKYELMEYCANDVKILTMSIMTFRNLFETTTGIDPLTRAFTLASIGLEYFRAAVLTDKTIGICPINGYDSCRLQSKVAKVWMDYIEHINDITILREQHIGTFWCDGFAPNTKTVYEFFGCRYHGCFQCFPDNRDQPIPELNNRTNNQLLSSADAKVHYYGRRGFNVESIWECGYKIRNSLSDRMKEYTSERIKYYNDIDKYGGADIRESFFGGRTNNLVFTYDCEPSESIKYFDFTSLYPHVLVSNDYPVGHPVVKTKFPSLDISAYFGFIKCIVLPPKQLNLGVLPMRINKKLYFPLCKICADTNNQDSCSHTDEERCLIGTWTTAELNKAIEKDYRIVKIIQVLDYAQKSNSIFQPYIKTWLKIKTEASGWPRSCVTETDKMNYLTKFYEKEGIELTPEKIAKNEGLRYIAKLMLNTLWGKLGQNNNQGQTVICTDYDEYHKLVSDPTITITGEIMVTDNKLLVNHKYIDNNYDRTGNTSPAIASFVTSYARLKLYNAMEEIEKKDKGRVLYFDTDSIIFRHKDGQYLPELGDFLGEFTDEVNN